MHKIIIGLIFLFAHTTYSQYTLSGSVLDQNTGKPVPGATVYLPEVPKGTSTDSTGSFFLSGLSEGVHQVQVSYLGYATRKIEIEIPAGEALKITLEPAAIEMQEVIISTPFHQLQHENVMKVDRVRVEKLQRSGAMSLVEGIAKMPGVETISTGSGIGKPVIRGLSANRVLVYSQGVRLENQQFGDEHGLGVNSSGVASVEVIKGPASLLYGSDALGGVIYLNPESFAESGKTVVDAETGFMTNTLGVEANMGYKRSGEKIKFLARGNYEAHSDYETGDERRVTNTRHREWDFKSGLGFQNENYEGDLRYNFNRGFTGIPETIGVQALSKEITKPYQEVNNHILSLDNTFSFKRSSLEFKAGYLFNNRKEFEEHHETTESHPEEYEEPALEMHLETINYDLKYHFPESDLLETIVGAQGMFQTNRNLGAELLIPDASVHDFGLMGTSLLDLGRTDIQVGLRYDYRQIRSDSAGSPGTADYIAHLDRDFNSYNGAIGIKIKFDPYLVGRLNLASGFRAPNLAELTSNGSHHGAQRYEIGNPNLNNEQNYQLDLSLEYSRSTFGLFANAFYNSINDYIFLDPRDEFRNGDPVFQYVQDDAELFGGEFGFQLHPSSIKVIQLESSYELVIGQRVTGQSLPLIPAPSISNTLTLDLPTIDHFRGSYATFTVETVFNQDRTARFEAPSDGYSLLSASIGTTLNILKVPVGLEIAGHNLLNQRYIAHLSRLKKEGIPNMGRNILIRLDFDF